MNSNALSIAKLMIIDNEINKKLTEFSVPIVNIYNLLLNIKDDRYGLKKLIGKKDISYDSKNLQRVVYLWFDQVWLPKIRQELTQFVLIDNTYYLKEKYHFLLATSNVTLPFDVDDVLQLQVDIKNNLLKFFTNFEWYLTNYVAPKYSFFEYVINFPFFGDIIYFVQSLIILPVKTRGPIYYIINRLDDKVMIIMNYCSHLLNYFKKLSHDNDRFINNIYEKITAANDEKWYENAFFVVRANIINMFLTFNNDFHYQCTTHQAKIEIALKLIFEKNGINNLSQHHQDIFTELLTNVVKFKILLDEQWENWVFNKQTNICCKKRRKKITKFSSNYKKTWDLVLKMLNVLIDRIVITKNEENLVISKMPVYGVMNKANLHAIFTNFFLNIEKGKKFFFLQSHYHGHILSQKTNILANLTNFNFKNYQEWEFNNSNLEICSLSTKITDNNINMWEEEYLAKVVALTFEEYKRLGNQYYNHHVEVFITNCRNIIARDYPTIIIELQKEITNFYEETLALLNLFRRKWKNWTKYIETDYCSSKNQLLIIDDFITTIFEELLYKWIPLFKNKNDLEELKNIITRGTSRYYLYNFGEHLEITLFFGANLEEIFNDFHFFSDDLALIRNYTLNLQENNGQQRAVLNWYHNEQPLFVCSTNFKETSQKAIVTFLTTETKNKIVKWQYFLIIILASNIENEYYRKITFLKESFQWFLGDIKYYFAAKKAQHPVNNNTIFSKNNEFKLKTIILSILDDINIIFHRWKTSINVDDCYYHQMIFLGKVTSKFYHLFSYNNVKIKTVINKLNTYKPLFAFAYELENSQKMRENQAKNVQDLYDFITIVVNKLDNMAKPKFAVNELLPIPDFPLDNDTTVHDENLAAWNNKKSVLKKICTLSPVDEAERFYIKTRYLSKFLEPPKIEDNEDEDSHEVLMINDEAEIAGISNILLQELKYLPESSINKSALPFPKQANINFELNITMPIMIVTAIIAFLLLVIKWPCRNCYNYFTRKKSRIIDDEEQRITLNDITNNLHQSLNKFTINNEINEDNALLPIKAKPKIKQKRHLNV